MNLQETQQVIARDEKWVPSTERVKISPTNAFTISVEVPEIFMQQFWYTIKKVKDSESYKFLLANKKCIVDAEVFRKILDICPRVKGEEFTDVQDDDATLTFIIDFGYKGPLHKHTSMYVDHMHQPWRTLAAIINKCLSRKIRSNDRLRKSRIDILWGMFYRENVDYLDGGIVNRLKVVRIREEYPKYGLPIPDMMMNDKIKQSESYEMFLKYFTGLIPPKKSRDTMQALKENKKTSRRQPGTGGSSEGTGRIPGVPDESTVVSAISSEGTGTKPGVPDEEKEEEKKDNDGNADDEDEDNDHISDIQDIDNEDAETESKSNEIYKYKIQVHKDVDVEMTVEEKGDAELAGNAMTSDYQVKESTELPVPSSSLSISSRFDTHFLNLSSDVSLTGVLKDSAEAEISSLMMFISNKKLHRSSLHQYSRC
ncbi:hypothetical protein Tco_1031944 [Tanacetum coccineum]|uniref:BTB domain-containing protein n=1 Tax=Tanacetum coccineum TaxID=301880 RepID=A0ABQ5GAH2_9ASTR